MCQAIEAQCTIAPSHWGYSQWEYIQDMQRASTGKRNTSGPMPCRARAKGWQGIGLAMPGKAGHGNVDRRRRSTGEGLPRTAPDGASYGGGA
jgi:hypothetical protein